MDSIFIKPNMIMIIKKGEGRGSYDSEEIGEEFAENKSISSNTNSYLDTLDTEISNLRSRILPILLFCQANKGDLDLYKNWYYHEDRNKKYFYAYYSGLFCRILCLLDTPSCVTEKILDECQALLDKYNWYNIQETDLKLFRSGDTCDCEVPEALAFIDGVDNVAWKNSGFGNGRDAVCLKMEHSSITFADVRGSVQLNK